MSGADTKKFTRAKNRNRRPHRRSIRLDGVNPSDFFKYDFTYCCEQCGHYNASQGLCTMGYVAQHTRDRQLSLYNLTGKMAFCRFMEID